MARTSHIKRRGAVYQAQLAVPLDLQATLGRKTMDRSLRTKDPQEAKRRILDVLKEWRDLFANARRDKALGAETQLKLSAGQLAARLYLSDIKFDEELRTNDHRYAGFEIDATDAAPFRDGYSGKLSDRELEQLVGDRIAYYRQQGLIQAKSGSEEWREIAQALCVARYEGLLRRAERNDGDFTGKPAHPIFLNVVSEPTVPQADEEILDLYDRYARENAKAVSNDTLVQGRRDVRLPGRVAPWPGLRRRLG